MEQDQIRQVIVLVVSVPVRQFDLALEVALGLDALPPTEDLFAGGRISEVPTLSRFVGKVARGIESGLVVTHSEEGQN
ncbi:MAG: hypothetical protein HY268_08885 [Deltaproteobacteria bacterium]|nr:hypothetical protein [Deltaproteobacteria bacterium]